MALLLPAPCCANPAASGEAPLVEWGALYVADALRNVHGGLREGSAYLDYLELAAAYDAGRALGVGDLTLFASLFRTNSPTFSDRYVGDAMAVSSIDSERALRVLEAWIDWGFDARGPGSLRVGLYDLNSEFDTTESRRLFVNSAYGIGQELAQTGHNGPSIFPVTALAARLAWMPREAWQLELAVVDGVPGDPEGTHRGRLHLSRSEGALCIAEATVAMGPLAQLSLGHWQYTETFAVLRPKGPVRSAALEDDNRGTYLTAEFAPGTSRAGDAVRWRAFVRAGEANSRINIFERHVAAGVVVNWPWPAGPGSQLGLAVAEARVGADYRARQQSLGNPADRYERNVELTWRVPLGEHVVLQPDLQHVVNPGADQRVPDAWVIGLRIELAVSR